MYKKNLNLILAILLIMLASCSDTSQSDDLSQSPNISTSDSKEEPSNIERLTYEEIIDDNTSLYLLDTKEEYNDISGLVKDETFYNRGSYSYNWHKQDQNKIINLSKNLKLNEDRYCDLSSYDNIYLDMYSYTKTSSDFLIAIFTSAYPETYTYFYYKISVNFEGFYTISIPLNTFISANNPDYSKVTNVYLYSTGWSMTPDANTSISFNLIGFTKDNLKFNMDETKIKAQNYTNAIQNANNLFTGGYDKDNSILTARQEALTKTAKALMNKINENECPFGSKPRNSSDMTNIYSNIYNLAQSYNFKNQELYHDKELLKKIVYALDYMNDNYYSKRGSVLSSGDNWWDWQIGSAQYLVNTLLLISNDISREELVNYLAPLHKYNHYPSMTMANRMDIAYTTIMAGILEHDYKLIAKSEKMIEECFQMVVKGDGFYEDGSFIQHSVYAYVGGYGDAFLKAFTNISYILNNTCFRIKDELILEEYNLISNAYLPLMYNGAYYDLVRGRSVDRALTGLGSSRTTVETFVLFTKINQNNNESLKEMLKNWYLDNENYYKYSMSPCALSIITEIINDKDIESINQQNYARVYPNMDKTVAYYDNVGFGISMSSKRTGKYESINNEFKEGWYSGDGMTYVYLNPNDYGSNFWQNVNRYRLPGTTVTTALRNSLCFSSDKALASNDFVGGVYYDTTSVSAMQLSSAFEVTGFESSLKANKAYFTFDDKMVCLGSKITSDDDYETITIVENRKLNGKLYIGDRLIEEKSGIVDANIIYIENYGGIYFPNYENVKYNITDKDFLEIYIEHGLKIENKDYAYRLLPNVNKIDIASIAKKFVFTQTDNVSMVEYNDIVGFVMWPGSESYKIKNMEFKNQGVGIIKNNTVILASPDRISKIQAIIDSKEYIFDLVNKVSVSIKIK